MAGHSKWTNTKHRKAAQDAKRGKIFTKIIRELVTASKLEGGDIECNSRLRAAVDKALTNNMTRDTLNRAITRGVGGNDNTRMENIFYEGYGPGGTAIMVECLSNNRNRTVSQVRYSFNKTGGNLGDVGSVSYMFTKRGVVSFAPGFSENIVMNAALEAGADDLITYDNGAIDVYTTPRAFYEVKSALQASGLTPESSKVTLIPSSSVNLDVETASKLLRLINMLKDSDDVQAVYHNGGISDEITAIL
ncbi:YebC/PmpR family DNA-binding transcriptional regulator [Sodalis endosymbiont of Henestaris halophilus]|uniref:YebC/PmpR family DNA-binding transcriptional regulator n=1 Tax=Sodalis endosymbiont of Henestaris halophilus TaxID=1929246 RepID=UPI000BBFA582|nr:YebC/PmpR family DNA-binding transcriptional regulator [Sodalis endosymbiont of Henestaris halophilus]SNC58448.1 putative transcriptional regulatory protein YebC [Sodalis endosymbiont of Henestaris halophilus]